MLMVIQAVCLLMVWAQLARKIAFCDKLGRICRVVRAQGFQFESPEYQWRELFVKEKRRFEQSALGKKP